MTPLVYLMTMSSYVLAIIFVLETAQNAVQVQLDNWGRCIVCAPCWPLYSTVHRNIKMSLSKSVPTREYWTICIGPGFLAAICFGSSPLLSLSVNSTGDTQENWEREEKGGKGWGRSQIIRRRKSLVLYNHSILSGTYGIMCSTAFALLFSEFFSAET